MIKESKPIKPEAVKLCDLANMYKVSCKTFKKWLEKMPDKPKRLPGSSYYSPKQVEQIFKHLGEP